MKPEDLGRVMSRSIGLFLFVIGLVSLIDHFVFFWAAQDAIYEMGWSNYEPVEGTSGSDGEETGDNSSAWAWHDTYAVASGGLLSPIGSGLLLLFGLIFTFLSRPIGRFIAGSKSD